ncbi:MAG: hypothetical protein SNI18_00840 [Rikenellaceae bacterium]
MGIKQYFSDLYFTLRVYRRGWKLRTQNYSIFKPRRKITTRTVIAMLDYRNQKIGLADRLKGAIYTYNCVKELRAKGVDVEFKIDYFSPFELSTYLIPASYDWQISQGDISYNPTQVEIIKFGTRGDNQRHRDYLLHRIANSRHNKIHVYCNRFDDREGAFTDSFNELFKPSPRVQAILDTHTKALGTGYIDVTLRFQNLLGDFDEGEKRKALSSEQEQQDLIERCMEQIENIHSANPQKRVLVTSESRRFLDVAAQKPYVYTIDGELVHMAFTQGSSFDMHSKAFVDYLMIAGADKIYLLQTGRMFNSGFPHTAAMIKNKPFEKIIF